MSGLITEERIRADLEALGVARGMTLIVHSSLSSIGRVDGGPATVVRALLHVVGEGGTLAMPAATPQCAEFPVFDREQTPTRMGAIPETFRTWRGTLRSDHPLESVCARGPLAAAVTDEHPDAFSEGPGSPFDKLREYGAHVLLLGVGFNRCTALHHAETRARKRRTTTVRFPRLDGGRTVWIEVPNVADDNDTHFPIIGERFVSSGQARLGKVGVAPSVFFPLQALDFFAIGYFEATL